MKANKIFYGLLASGLAFAGLTQSCVSDAPFADGDGEGTLRLQLMVNSDLTRAELDTDQLMDSCVVYISNSKGLLYKYKGDDIPAALPLKFGSYIAEAWTGDSVPASFTSRFFRGYYPFEIDDPGYKTVQVSCKIANVAVNLDQASITDDMLKDWTVEVFNSTGSLLFDAATPADSIGYYMMPKADYAYDGDRLLKGEDGWPMFTNLRYRLKGTMLDGSSFEKTGLIGSEKHEGKYVEHAHLYTLKFTYNPDYEAQGGSLIDIVVDDTEIEVKDEVGIFSRPAIKGIGFDVDEDQVVGSEGGFTEPVIVKVAGFNGIDNILLTSDDADVKAMLMGGVDLRNIAPDYEDSFKASSGIDWDYDLKEKTKASTSYVKFTPDFLNRLSEREEEYRINFHVVDGNGRENDAVLHIAVGEDAIVTKSPVVFDGVVGSGDLLAVRANYATVTGKIYEGAPDARIRYRQKGSAGEWAYVAIPAATRAASADFAVKLPGLNPSTAYEYQAECGEFLSELMYFTTEGTFQLPNADMEQWGQYSFKPYMGGTKQVVFPGTGDAPTFWSSGNAGSSMANITLTNESGDMYHSGSRSAKLVSQSTMGIIAAGNILSGDFLRMPSMMSAEVSFGRPYEGGSHPDALSVWVNYRPKQVTSEGQGLTKQMKDHGQIFIAFATGPSIVNTNDKVYFNPEASNILGYGEITWKGEDYGPEGQLKQVVIPIKWYDKAKTTPATHIIIVAAASKFGDYFAGGDGSTMYLDDFELIYDLDN